MAECDLCRSEDKTLYPIRTNELGAGDTKHICDLCIKSVLQKAREEGIEDD